MSPTIQPILPGPSPHFLVCKDFRVCAVACSFTLACSCSYVVIAGHGSDCPNFTSRPLLRTVFRSLDPAHARDGNKNLSWLCACTGVYVPAHDIRGPSAIKSTSALQPQAHLKRDIWPAWETRGRAWLQTYFSPSATSGASRRLEGFGACYIWWCGGGGLAVEY